jgi:hypothetical protein
VPARLEAPKRQRTIKRAIAQERALLSPSAVLAPTRFIAHGSSALCDGRRTIEEIARDGGIELELAIDLCTSLYANASVSDAGDTTVAPLLFLEHVRALCARVRRTSLDAQPALDALFASGAYTPRLAIGYLVEVTHFISTAAAHIASAIASSPDAEVQLALSEYLAEEYWHGDWMKRSLIAAGLSERDFERAIPLPATRAVIDAWQLAARTDLLLYGGLIAVTESSANEAAELEALFERTVSQNVLSEAAWRPYFEHAFGDSGADHLAYGSVIYARAEPMSRARRDALRDRLLLHTQSVLAMERAIIEFYGADRGPSVHSVEWR